MEKPAKHLFVCASFRTNGAPQGICHKKGSTNLLGYIESELGDRGMDGVTVTATGCVKACERGPVMIVYPENTWYGGVESEDDVDAILDALEKDTVAKQYLLT